jgi:hypothetical protein
MNFDYEGFTADGKPTKGSIEAATKEEATEKLRHEEGIFAQNITPEGELDTVLDHRKRVSVEVPEPALVPSVFTKDEEPMEKDWPSGEMFSRFTDRARKVMGFARLEATERRHDYLGTDHILLGLVREGSGVAANVIENLGIKLEDISHEVNQMTKNGPMEYTGSIVLTPRAEKILVFAKEQATSLGHNYIGTEHLMLGVLCESEGVAAQVLMNLGLSLKKVRQEVMDLLGYGEPVEVKSTVPEPPPEAQETSSDPRWKIALKAEMDAIEEILDDLDAKAVAQSLDRGEDGLRDYLLTMALDRCVRLRACDLLALK